MAKEMAKILYVVLSPSGHQSLFLPHHLPTVTHYHGSVLILSSLTAAFSLPSLVTYQHYTNP